MAETTDRRRGDHAARSAPDDGAAAPDPTTSPTPTMFRPAALAHYEHEQSRSAMPSYRSRLPRLLLALLLLALAALAAAVLLVRVPVYAKGPALVIEGDGTSGDRRPLVVAVLPAAPGADLPGRPLRVSLPGRGAPIELRARATTPTVDVRPRLTDRLRAAPSIARAVRRGGVVVDAVAAGGPARSLRPGESGRALVEVGRRTLLGRSAADGAGGAG